MTAFTDTTLKETIKNYLENDETTFVSELDRIITQAEERILFDAQLPDFRKNVTGNMTDGNPYLGVPTDFLSPYSLMIDNQGGKFLRYKEVSFIREVYPTSGNRGVPKYYSLFSDEYFLIGPTPNSNFSVELHYFYKPESIVIAGTSWLGTHAQNALLYGCLLEGYTFNKGEQDMFQVYSDRYNDALQKLKLLAEGRNKIDSYRVS
jgi:hypothetical protein